MTPIMWEKISIIVFFGIVLFVGHAAYVIRQTCLDGYNPHYPVCQFFAPG